MIEHVYSPVLYRVSARLLAQNACLSLVGERAHPALTLMTSNACNETTLVLIDAVT